MELDFLKDSKVTFTKKYDFIINQPFTEKAKALIKSLPVSEDNIKSTLCVLLRVCFIQDSHIITTTTDWISQHSGISKSQVGRSLTALRMLKFINWDNKGVKTAREITVDYELIKRMLNKWVSSTSDVKPTVVKEVTAPAPTPAPKEPEPKEAIPERKQEVSPADLPLDQRIERLRQFMVRNLDKIKTAIGDNPQMIPPSLSEALKKVWGGDYYQSFYGDLLRELGLWQ